MIEKIIYEAPDQRSLSMPAIILSSFNRLSDFLILSYLFQDKELTLIMPHSLPEDKDIDLFRSINHVLYLKDRIGYGFFRQVLTTLRDFNRCIVISPDAAKRYLSHIPVDAAVIARIAMLANIPIVPVVLEWGAKKGGRNRCTVRIRKRIYVSPRNEELKDFFFGRKGVQKYTRLPQAGLVEIGRHILSKINEQQNNKDLNGSNLQE